MEENPVTTYKARQYAKAIMKIAEAPKAIAIQDEKFTVAGKPGDVAEKISTMYKEFGLVECVSPEHPTFKAMSRESRGRVGEGITELHVVEEAPYVGMLAVLAMSNLPIDKRWTKALVVGYKDNPNISTVFPTTPEITAEKMGELELELIKG